MVLRSYPDLDILLLSIIIIMEEYSQALNTYFVKYLVEVPNMLLVLYFTCCFQQIIWGCMCSTVRFQCRWLQGYIYNSCYYHHQIRSIHLSQIYTFPWLCAWDVCYIIFWHLLHIHSGRTGNLFSLSVCSWLWVQIAGYILACRSHSFVCTLHHLIIIILQSYVKTRKS